ncbi:MAG: VanZ family protein [Bacteroidetes bacterium]|nr:VanZ family protein [Bacteroidota bacterium]
MSGVPGNMIPKVENFWSWLRPDKIMHIFLYGVFFYLLLNSVAKHLNTAVLGIKRLIILLTIGIIFAALTEILQAKIFINRDGSLYDFIANMIGCLAGLTIYLVTSKKKHIKL